MKNFILSAAAVCLALISCSKEAPVVQEPILDNFTFTAVSEAMSAKAGLASDGKSLQWKVGDTVKLFFPKEGVEGETVISKAEVISVAQDGTATFSGTIPAGADATEVIASYNDWSGATEEDLHPYKVVSGNAFTRHRVRIPSRQVAVLGSYDPESAPLVGRWTGNAGDPIQMTFKNPSALLAIEIDNNSTKTIDSVIFSNSAKLASYTYYLSADREGFSWKTSKETSTEISLRGTFADGKYYFVITGESLTLTDMKVTFVASDEKKAVFSNSKTLSTLRNNIYNIGKFTLTDDSFDKKESGIAFDDTKVNMDESFYTKLIAQCTGTDYPYTLSKTVTIDNITVKPSSTNLLIKSGPFITNRGTFTFTSASAGDAELVLFCSIVKTKKFVLKWTDKNGTAKTVPTEVSTALTNSGSSDVYYKPDGAGLTLSLPGVEVGDILTIDSGYAASNQRMYQFIWKAAATKSGFGTQGAAGTDGNSETYPETL